MSKVMTKKNNLINLLKLRQSLTELDIEFIEQIKKIENSRNQEINNTVQEIGTTSNNPDNVIKFSFGWKNSTVKVHEDNIDLYNAILKKYKEISKKGEINLSNYISNNLSIIRKANKLGYRVKMVDSSSKKVRFVMKKDVEVKQTETVDQ